ncbi:MAG TPA: NFACT RNA binding domain-containing protein [Bacteroidota bacterium]|nr:NFACT RNA binding domain-containing protein [Bacteroidota bacterium]
MIANYYTLLHIARDLDQRLGGKHVTEIFSQNRNELIIQCGENDCVLVSCEPSLNYVAYRPSFARAKKNSLDFFQPLTSRTISSVSLSLGDREMIFRTDDRASLVVQMFGSKANVLLVTTDYTIQQSFLKPKDYVGSVYTTRQSDNLGFSNEQEFRKALTSFHEVPVGTALRKMFRQFGAELVQELMSRAGVQGDALSSDANASALFKAHVQLLSSLTASPSPRVYYEGSAPKAFSIIPLNQYHHLKTEVFDSIHDALRTFVAGRQRDKQFLNQKNEILKIVGREVDRSARTLQKLAEEMDSDNRSQEYETMGKLLLANLETIRKGMKKVELNNIFANSAIPTAIPIEPGLTAAQNAERYFQKAKKARSSEEENRERKKNLTQRVDATRTLLEELESSGTSEEFMELAIKNAGQLEDFGIRLDQRGVRSKAKEDRVPFRVFVVAGGFQVWVGKSSENNDVLTMKYAKPNDLWFHARGSSGSHVVLKLGTGKGEPSKQAIEQAAAIAAYYSKMKNSKTVPVAMTQRKYVRKPKGAPAGTVTLEREKLIFVEPKLPTNDGSP